MVILLGSESKQKINILRETLESLVLRDFEIMPIKVSSGITEQPLDLETTVRGSINRAQGAAQAYGDDFDFSFGMEAGLEMRGGIYDFVCSVAITIPNGSMSFGQGGHIPLPKEVSDRVLSGAYLGSIIREYCNKSDLDIEERNAVEDLINRRKVFTSAIINACSGIYFK